MFFMVLNNILVTSWRSVLLVEETGVPGENHRPAQVTDKLYHKMLYTSPITLVVIGTDYIYIGSSKSNYHTITSTTAPVNCIGKSYVSIKGL